MTELEASELQWSDEKNARRCLLIEKEVDGGLSPEERFELETLQEEMLRYRRAIAPLPLKEAETAMLKAENAALRNQIYVLQGEILLLKSKTVTVWNNDDEQNWWEQRELEPPK